MLVVSIKPSPCIGNQKKDSLDLVVSRIGAPLYWWASVEMEHLYWWSVEGLL